MQNKKDNLATLEMIIAMIISGSIGLFVIKSGQQPEDIVFFRCAIAFLCLLPVCALSGYLKTIHFSPKKLIMMVVSGWCLVFNWILFFKAFSLTSISLATIVYHVNPFIILFLGAFVFKEKFPASDGIWVGLGFLGLLIIVGINGTSISENELLGLGLVLLATTLYSCSVLITKKLTGSPPLVIVLVQTLAGTLATSVLTSTDFARGDALDQWRFLVPLGAVHTALLYWLIYSAVARINLSAVAILSFIYPISTVVFDYIFFDHVISLAQSLGAALILIATVAVKLHWKPTLRFGRNQ